MVALGNPVNFFLFGCYSLLHFDQYSTKCTVLCVLVYFAVCEEQTIQTGWTAEEGFQNDGSSVSTFMYRSRGHFADSAKKCGTLIVTVEYPVSSECITANTLHMLLFDICRIFIWLNINCRYWWAMIRGLCDIGDYAELDRFSKQKKPPIGFEVCCLALWFYA